MRRKHILPDRPPRRGELERVEAGLMAGVPENYTVYVLISREGGTYVGMTNHLERRLREHRQGKSRYTSKHTDWKILHTERYSDRVEARKREKYFKSASGRRFIAREYFS